MLSWERVESLRTQLQILFDSDMTVEGLEGLLRDNQADIDRLETQVKEEAVARRVRQKDFEALTKQMVDLTHEKDLLIRQLEAKGVDGVNFRESKIMDGYR